MNHVVLAGDSIFDNAAYVERGQSVIEQLLAKANNDFDTTLVAVDGSITSELAHQFTRLPSETTHLFISSGGNDALASARLLAESVSTAWQAMGLFAEVVDRF